MFSKICPDIMSLLVLFLSIKFTIKKGMNKLSGCKFFVIIGSINDKIVFVISQKLSNFLMIIF